MYEISTCVKNWERVGNLKSFYKSSPVQRSCGQDLTYLDTSNWNTGLRIAVDCGFCWPQSRGRNSWKKPTDLSNLTGLPCLYKMSVWQVTLLSGLDRKFWPVTLLTGLDRKFWQVTVLSAWHESSENSLCWLGWHVISDRSLWWLAWTARCSKVALIQDTEWLSETFRFGMS